MNTKKIWLVSLSTLAITGCGFYIGEDDDYDGYHESYYYSERSNSASVGSASNGSTELNKSAENEHNISACGNKSCYKVPVRVHYMLTENIGPQSVVIEAFDNQYFQGAPLARKVANRLDTAKPGTFVESEMSLPAGEYFVRAYLNNNRNEVTPYEYEGMELISNMPVGLYGAASHAETLTVTAAQSTKPAFVQIYLDKLFKRPHAEEPTQAHLRVIYKFATGFTVPAGRTVYFELFDKPDFNYIPMTRMEAPSEMSMINGREGIAEFLSPELPIGQYFLRIYLDVNGNRFMDRSEPRYIFFKHGESAKIDIIAQRTETIEAELKVETTESVD